MYFTFGGSQDHRRDYANEGHASFSVSGERQGTQNNMEEGGRMDRDGKKDGEVNGERERVREIT